MSWALRVSMTALFLRGIPRAVTVPKKRRPLIESVVRRRNPSISQLAETLAEEGMWLEATTLQTTGLIDLAESLVASEQVLTSACEGYPQRWLDVLGASAPPALWRRGEMPSGPSHAVVGSRHISRPVAAFARRAASAVVESGGVVVSGAAMGCDRAAAAGADTSLIEIVPHGLDFQSPRPGAVLSVAAPNEEFSTALAMERNALIYASSELSLVVYLRLKEGGTWVGATSALRQRLTAMLVRDYDDPAVDSLVALGARRLADAAAFPAFVPEAATLFG
jgi:predicted Rossmann fold nucleotide-binding protein DprA/Smf involved in DNA uptake